MRASTIVMVGITVVFGLLTVFVAQVWLNNQANLQAKNLEANKKPVAMQAVVVAKQPLRFGTEFNAGMLKEGPWPVDAMPSGAFSKIVDVLHGGRCVVLRGDYKRARERLDAAQRKDPGNKHVQNNLQLLEDSYRKGGAIQ